MSRELFFDHALEVAPQLLGAHLAVLGDDGAVRIRITEVEAYHGVGTPGPYDGGSHSRSRRTERNASMFGPPGHAYVYLSHGIHFALNLVCSPEAIASGVLIRSGEVIAGEGIARRRREAKRAAAAHGREAPPIPRASLARGPGNLATALGITRPEHDGLDLFAAPFEFVAGANDAPTAVPSPSVAHGPRVGVSGEFGGPAFPWRFWIAGDPTVSAYRPGRNVPGR